MITKTQLYIIIGIFIVLNIADIITTEISLSNGFEEINPIANYFFEKGIAGKIFIYSLSFFILIFAPIILEKKSKIDLLYGIVIGIMFSIKAGVVIWNIKGIIGY